jgi:hypothetical protein
MKKIFGLINLYLLEILGIVLVAALLWWLTTIPTQAATPDPPPIYLVTVVGQGQVISILQCSDLADAESHAIAWDAMGKKINVVQVWKSGTLFTTEVSNWRRAPWPVKEPLVGDFPGEAMSIYGKHA